MGQRNPDRVNFAEIAGGIRTVGQMLAAGWALRVRCPVCHTQVIVGLPAVVQRHGRDLSLWDFHTQCWCMSGKLRCTGRVTFQALPHPRMQWTDLVAQSLMRGSLGGPTVRIDPVDGRPIPPPPDRAI